MCPHCGRVWADNDPAYPQSHGLTPSHSLLEAEWCPGSGQNPRNSLTDGRALWSGASNPHYYRNHQGPH